MASGDSLLGRLALAARPTRPWCRVSLPPRWARLLLAAGATKAAESPTVQPNHSPRRTWAPSFAVQFHRLGTARASTDHTAADRSAAGGGTWRLDEYTTLSAYSPAQLGQVEITVVTARQEWRDKLLPLRIDGVEYLLAMGESAEGSRGGVIVETDADSPSIELGQLRAMDSLTPDDSAILTQSAAGASSVSRKTWANALRRFLDNDQVRDAISAGLQQ